MRRREVLLTLPALLLMRRAFAQSPPLQVRGINHVGLAVSDVKRSVDFYQGLFGMPIISRQGSTVNLQIGAGPQFLSLTPAAGSPPTLTMRTMVVLPCAAPPTLAATWE